MVQPEDAGQIVIAGSHGALLGGDPASALGADALMAVFHDAGIGIDEAGIARQPGHRHHRRYLGRSSYCIMR